MSLRPFFSSSALLGQVLRRSDGVPLYVEQLLAASGGLSTTLRLNLIDRLAGLSSDAQQYLEAAAVRKAGRPKGSTRRKSPN